MIGDLIADALLRLVGEIIILGIIAILISMGLSEGQAHGVFVLLAIVAIYRTIQWEKKRRELLGKAADLDLDGDGKIDSLPNLNLNLPNYNNPSDTLNSMYTYGTLDNLGNVNDTVPDLMDYDFQQASGKTLWFDNLEVGY